MFIKKLLWSRPVFLPSMQLIAPSLWFLSSLGLGQFNPSSIPTIQPEREARTVVAQKTNNPAIMPKRSPPKSQSRVVKKRITPKIPFAKKTNVVTPQKDGCTTIKAMEKNVECVIEKLQQKYRSVKSMSANFKQTYTYAVYQRKQISEGKVFLKSPGRMRWDYRTPTTKVFVADGETLWVYEPDKNQAYQRLLKESQLPIAIRFLMGQGDLLKAFKPTFESASVKTVTVRLVPKKPTTKYKELAMVINRSDFMVQETTIVDSVNNTNQVRFSKVRLNLDLPESGFRFVPPPNVTILR